MEKPKVFQKNLELWSKTCPKEAVLLPYVNCGMLEESVTIAGEPNLKKKAKPKAFALHSPSGAAKEAQQWFKSLALDDVFLVCVYGVGLGYYYEAISPWLKENRRRHVVFLEDDLAVIHKLFETERGSKMLQDPQVQIVYFKDFSDPQVFNVLYWNFAMTRLEITALQSYQKNQASPFEELKHKISYDAAKNNALVDEYLRYGVDFYLNFYQNLLSLHKSYLGNKFFGKFYKVPVIICGAGPSLAKQLPLLRRLCNKALLFAGGSAINVLNAHDIQPHLCAALDPNQAQLERIASNTAYEVPFFYRNRLHHGAFKMIHAPRLYITGAGGYDVAEFFEKKFKINAEFMDEGHNVVNFCVQIAKEMGCGPIIFLGMDLAFTGNKGYSPGVVADSKVDNASFVGVKGQDEIAVLKKDIFGNPTYTLWKWVTEAEWIGEFAKNNPTMKLINCTEGGLGFPGVENCSFSSIAKKYLTRDYELRNRIHGEVQNASMSKVTYSKIVKAMKDLSRSLERTMEWLSVLIDEVQRVISRYKEGEKEVQQSGKAALAETELAEEDGFKHVVDNFNEAYTHMLCGEVHDIHMRYRSEDVREQKKLPLLLKKYRFLLDVAHVNLELIKYALSESSKGVASETYETNFPLTVSKKCKYSFGKGRILINDPEMGLDVDESYKPVLVPEKRKEGQKLSSGHIVRTIFDNKWKLCECYLEKDGMMDGQCLLFYPDGTVKEETFYREGKIHGPATFFDKTGQVLAKSWFMDGSQEGRSWWYYPTGSLYSLQRFKKNQWDGPQEYYYEDGSPKTLLMYKKGKLVSKVIRRY